jgi:hypothetical protein
MGHASAATTDGDDPSIVEEIEALDDGIQVKNTNRGSAGEHLFQAG